MQVKGLLCSLVSSPIPEEFVTEFVAAQDRGVCSQSYRLSPCKSPKSRQRSPTNWQLIVAVHGKVEEKYEAQDQEKKSKKIQIVNTNMKSTLIENCVEINGKLS